MPHLRSRVQYQQGTRGGRHKGISKIAVQGCARKYHRAGFVRTLRAGRSAEAAQSKIEIGKAKSRSLAMFGMWRSLSAITGILAR